MFIKSPFSCKLHILLYYNKKDKKKMNQTIYDLILIGIAAITTFCCGHYRFLLLARNTVCLLRYKKVSESLPPAIMAVLVVYCIKDSISSPGSGTIVGNCCLVVIGLHLWKKIHCFRSLAERLYIWYAFAFFLLVSGSH